MLIAGRIVGEAAYDGQLWCLELLRNMDSDAIGFELISYMMLECCWRTSTIRYLDLVGNELGKPPPCIGRWWNDAKILWNRHRLYKWVRNNQRVRFLFSSAFRLWIWVSGLFLHSNIHFCTTLYHIYRVFVCKVHNPSGSCVFCSPSPLRRAPKPYFSHLISTTIAYRLTDCICRNTHALTQIHTHTDMRSCRIIVSLQSATFAKHTCFSNYLWKSTHFQKIE